MCRDHMDCIAASWSGSSCTLHAGSATDIRVRNKRNGALCFQKIQQRCYARCCLFSSNEVKGLLLNRNTRHCATPDYKQPQLEGRSLKMGPCSMKSLDFKMLPSGQVQAALNPSPGSAP